MFWTSERAASRHSRDRDLLPAGPRLGPYELRYDTRRGYDRPLRPGAAPAPSDLLLFRAREDDERAD